MYLHVQWCNIKVRLRCSIVYKCTQMGSFCDTIYMYTELWGGIIQVYYISPTTSSSFKALKVSLLPARSLAVSMVLFNWLVHI